MTNLQNLDLFESTPAFGKQRGQLKTVLQVNGTQEKFSDQTSDFPT